MRGRRRRAVREIAAGDLGDSLDAIPAHLSEPGKDVLVEALATAGFDFNEPPD